MEINTARTAGLCFGVEKAVNGVLGLIDNGTENICTLGPVIHNNQLIRYLESKGARVIGSLDEADCHSFIVIRAHGVPPEIYDELALKKLQYIDTTCPHVKKIHDLVKSKKDAGYKIIIAGDKEHPEVRGINGWCGNTAVVLKTADEAAGASFDPNDKYCIVAQTTITRDRWNEIIPVIEKKLNNLEKFDTICSATEKRLKEAVKLARNSDIFLVVGSGESSNTQKLYEMCTRYCDKVYLIESSEDLKKIKIDPASRVGVTAGASTPAWVIREVVDNMTATGNGTDDGFNFLEEFEKSMSSIRNGEIVKGRIIGFNGKEVFVDIGYKSDGILPIDEYSDDPFFNPQASIKVGEEIDVLVVKVNDGEGNVLLSKRKVDAAKGIDELEKAFNDQAEVSVRIFETTAGGVVAAFKGARIFIPASQLGLKYIKELNDYIGKEINIRIIEFNQQKKRIIGSQRVILESKRDHDISEFWNHIETGKVYSGTVKSLADFGAFVDLGGIDGLVHLSEISWKKIKHPSEVLNIGDKIEVSVIDYNKEKKRISLKFKKEEDDPWISAADKYHVGDVINGTVARLVPFGAFIDIEDGLEGLVHISQITGKRISKPGEVLNLGDKVSAKIIEINPEAKKINLSIREADIKVDE